VTAAAASFRAVARLIAQDHRVPVRRPLPSRSDPRSPTDRDLVGYLRKQGPAQVLLGAFRDAAHGGRMRIAHYSIQGNHLHLIVEADGSGALSAGMQGLSIRVAKRLNARLGRSGAVFVERYHAHILESRRAVANAIRYVAGNYRRHTREHLPPDFRDPLATVPLAPLERPMLWLLRTGWQLEPPRKPDPFEPP
jgi:putative transposase